MRRAIKFKLPAAPSSQREVVLLASIAVGTLLICLSSAFYALRGRGPKKPRAVSIKAAPAAGDKNEDDNNDPRKCALVGQGLKAVPRDVLALHHLHTLNLMNNALESLPEAIGQLTQLEVLGLKSNRLTCLPASIGNLTGLVALYLTDNALTTLPPAIGKLTKLRKLQASFNKLQSLPEEMGDMVSLELFRAAGCSDLHTIPSRLAEAPALTWLSLGGSKFCAAYSCNDNDSEEGNGTAASSWWVPDSSPTSTTSNSNSSRSSTRGALPPLVARQALTLDEKLGDGASGEVFLAQWQPPLTSPSSISSFAAKLTPNKKKKQRNVAVKVFRDDTSPDGRAIDELEVLCLLEHPNLTKVRALVVDDEAQPAARPVGVIMDVVPGEPMAAKPDHTSVLRCRWEAGKEFSTDVAMRVAKQVASALEHMHEKGICHGDMYAHNCVADEKGNVTLLDHGASFLYGRTEEEEEEEEQAGVDFERLEVRAFGLFVADLVERLSSTEDAQSKRRRSSSPFPTSLSPMSTPSLPPAAARALLEDVVAQCLVPEVSQRPPFALLAKQLAGKK